MKVSVWIPLAGLAVAGAAGASDLVVHEGDPATATRAVADAAKVDPTTLSALALSAWAGGRPPQLSLGTIEDCAGKTVELADFQKPLAAVDEALASQDWEFVLGPAKAAEKAALCVDGDLPAADLARVEFAVGLGAAANDDADGARDAWQQAARLDPSMDWAAKAPDSAKAALQAAVAEARQGAVSLVVVPVEAVRIDGAQPVDAKSTVAPGSHWARIGANNVRLHVEATGEPVLVAPSAVPAGATGWAADPARAQDLKRLADAISPGGSLYVVTQDGRVFRRSATGFDELGAKKGPATVAAAAPKPAPQDLAPVDIERPPREKEPFNPGSALLPVGGAIAVTGAVLSLTALGPGNQAAEDASAPNIGVASFQEARDRYDSAKTRVVVGDALLGAGIVVAGIGGGLLLDGASLSPWILPGGGGLGLTVGGAR